jgi:hypothetical protein
MTATSSAPLRAADAAAVEHNYPSAFVSSHVAAVTRNGHEQPQGCFLSGAALVRRTGASEERQETSDDRTLRAAQRLGVDLPETPE